MLNKLVPEPLSLPKLTPLIITQATIPESTEETTSQADASQPPEDRRQDSVVLSGPVALPTNTIPYLIDEGKNGASAPYESSSRLATEKRRKHWTITRTSASRSRARDAEDSEEPPLKRLKVPEPTDYGSFAILLGAIAAEQNIRAASFEDYFGSNEKQTEFARAGLLVPPGPETASTMAAEDELVDDEIVSLDAEAYVREVVYGGVDGLAYIRSLAEFCGHRRDTPVSCSRDLHSCFICVYKFTGESGR